LAARGTECQNRCLLAMVRWQSRRGCPLYGDQPFTHDASAVTCLVSIAPHRCSLIVLPAGLPCHVQQACPGGCRHIYTWALRALRSAHAERLAVAATASTPTGEATQCLAHGPMCLATHNAAGILPARTVGIKIQDPTAARCPFTNVPPDTDPPPGNSRAPLLHYSQDARYGLYIFH
jgi:hypothetical protein